MATGGEVHGQLPGSVGSEDLHQLKCQPCLEDGDLQEAVGMCIDCQDYLCLKCYQGHTIPKPMRRHQLLDREQIMKGQIRLSPKDACTEKCTVHDDEVIKYYCITHCKLGCSACITLDHTTCSGVQYIPQVAKDLATNEEYKQVERRLKSALKAFQLMSGKNKRNSEEFAAHCNETLQKIKEHRRNVEKAFDDIENNLVEKLQAMKSAELREIEEKRETYTKEKENIHSYLAKIKTLENSRQHCSSYIEMMRTKEKLKSLDAEIKEADMHKSWRHRQVKFIPNQDTLDTLKNLESFGTLNFSSKRTIVKIRYTQYINVKSSTDTKPCWITGSVVLKDGRLLLVDYNNNTVKKVHVQNGQILSQLKLSTGPRNVVTTGQNKVAVTLPHEKKIAIVTVDEKNLRTDKTITVTGECYGVDYKNDKLAVAFRNPDKVQVLNLQGTVLYDISADKQGHSIFNRPFYLAYGQDDTTLYVSNWSSHNVVCVKLDGTVVDTYTDSDLQWPRTPVVDSSGNVYVCAEASIHQISKDCRKLRVLLTEEDGLKSPQSICLDKEEEMLYVFNISNDCAKVYQRIQ